MEDKELMTLVKLLLRMLQRKGLFSEEKEQEVAPDEDRALFVDSRRRRLLSGD